jgi:hypothetical protein
MPEKVLYQGKAFYPQKSIYAIFIFPLVQIKKIFQALYNLLLKLMWVELVKGEIKQNDLAGILLFILFIALSWLSFILKNYLQLILIVFIVIWYIDIGIARQAYQQQKYNRPLQILEDEAGGIRWLLSLPENKILENSFNWGQVREMAIASRAILGGAFQEKLDQVWQVKLWLYDGSDWVIEEDADLIVVLKVAKKLQSYVTVPIQFAESYGPGDYAIIDLEESKTFIEAVKNWGIKCHKTERKWHLSSVWKFHHSWQFFKQVFKESGFLLFVLLMSAIMLQFGGLINLFVQGFRSQEPVIIEFAQSPAQLFAFWNWRSFLAFGTAIALMIYKGWQLSRVKHSFIDQYFLKVNLDNQAIGKVKTPEIEAVLLVPYPDHRILIISAESVVVIPKLPNLADSLLYLTYLQEAVNHFQLEHT